MKTITMIGQNYCVGINPEKIFSFSIKREDGWISLNINRGEVLIPILYITNAKHRELGYAEFNTKSDYCQECGYDGEILLDENREWYCPNCGNRNHKTLNVCRRTCGYLGDNFWNQGRTQEIAERFVHLDNHLLGE